MKNYIFVIAQWWFNAIGPLNLASEGEANIIGLWAYMGGEVGLWGGRGVGPQWPGMLCVLMLPGLPTA